MMQSVRKTLLFGAFLGVPFVAWGCGEKTVQVPVAGNSGPNQISPMGSEGGPSPIKGLMTKLARGPQSLHSAIERELREDAPAWATIKPQAREYAQLTASLGKEEPPKGSKDSWANLTSAFAESAASLDKAAAAEDKTAALAAHKILAASCSACHQEHRGGRGGFGGGDRGGFGGPGGFGGQRGGGFGGPPQPGQLLAPFLQDRLNLTPEQKNQLEELQKKVDSDLGKILTDEQKKQLKDMQGGMGRGGRGGFSSPGGPGGGPDRPGGPPDGGPGGRGPRGPENPDAPPSSPLGLLGVSIRSGTRSL
jgi:mono/diheme cytochrome c family protein